MTAVALKEGPRTSLSPQRTRATSRKHQWMEVFDCRQGWRCAGGWRGGGVGTGPLTHCWWQYDLRQPLGEAGDFLNMHPSPDPETSRLGIYP